MSSSRVSGIALSCRFNASAANGFQSLADLHRQIGEGLRLRSVASRRWIACVRRRAHRSRQWQSAEERYADFLGSSFRAAASERVGPLAAMRADIAGHILDDAQHGNVHLSEQVD